MAACRQSSLLALTTRAALARLMALLALLALLRALAAVLLLLLARTLVLISHLAAARALALVRTLLAAALAALRLLLLPLALLVLLSLLALLGLPRLLLLLSHCCLHDDAANCRVVLVASHMPGPGRPPAAGFRPVRAKASVRIYKALSRFTQPRAGCATGTARSAGRLSDTGRYGDCGEAPGAASRRVVQAPHAPGWPFRQPAKERTMQTSRPTAPILRLSGSR